MQLAAGGKVSLLVSVPDPPDITSSAIGKLYKQQYYIFIEL